MKKSNSIRLKAWILSFVSLLSLKTTVRSAQAADVDIPFAIEERENELTIADLPDFYKEQFLKYGEKETQPVKDLFMKRAFLIRLKNCEDLSWLKLSNLIELSLNFDEEIDSVTKDQLKNLNCTVVETNRPLAETIDVLKTYDYMESLTLNEYTSIDNLSELKNCKHLTTLCIRHLPIEKEEWSKLIDELSELNLRQVYLLNVQITMKEAFALISRLQNLENISNLTIFGEGYDYIKSREGNTLYISKEILGSFGGKFDVHMLPSNIKISFGDNPYDTAIFLTKEDVDYLKENNGFADDESTIESLYSINEQLDEIIEALNITSSDNDRQKLAKILLYVTKNYTYDQSFEGFNTDASFEKVYKGGFLYGIFHNNNKIICGNYTALINALLNRLGIENYTLLTCTFMSSHIWNIVKLDGSYYHVDATWLDDPENQFANEFKNGVNEILAILKYEWYLVSAEDINQIDPELSHKFSNLDLPADYDECQDYDFYNMICSLRKYYNMIESLYSNGTLVLILKATVLLEIVLLYKKLKEKNNIFDVSQPNFRLKP